MTATRRASKTLTPIARWYSAKRFHFRIDGGGIREARQQSLDIRHFWSPGWRLSLWFSN
jgi:hypothetical protein